MFFIYRLLLALFFTTVVAWSIVYHLTNLAAIKYYFIYLTNWGILLCMTCTWLGFALVVAWHFHPELPARIVDDRHMPHAFKVYWSLHNVTVILSLMITMLYWGIVYDEARDPLDAVNLLTHASNSIFMLLDLIIVSHPVRLVSFFLSLNKINYFRNTKGPNN